MMREGVESPGPATTLALHQHLTWLGLGGNIITAIRPRQLPSSLRELHLWKNQLEEAHLQELQSLEVLSISYNKLSSIGLQGNESFRELQIQGNPLVVKHLPPSVQQLQASFEQIADYDFGQLAHLEKLGIYGKEGLKRKDIRNLSSKV